MELGLRQAWAYAVSNLGLDPYVGSTGDKLLGWLSSDAIDIGDSALTAHGAPAAGVLTVLSAATRPHLRALLANAHGVSIKWDMLWAHFLAPLDAAQLDRAFTEVAALAAILTPPVPTTAYR